MATAIGGVYQITDDDIIDLLNTQLGTNWNKAEKTIVDVAASLTREATLVITVGDKPAA